MTPHHDPFTGLMSSTDSPLTVITTRAEQEQAGCLVGFHSQASISPPMYAFWLSKANHTYRVSLRARYFAIHFLTADDVTLAQRFGTRSGDDVDKFAKLTTETGLGAVPLIAALPNRMVVERVAMVDTGGDHVAINARVLSSQITREFTPLRLSHVDDLEPGHASEERAIDP